MLSITTFMPLRSLKAPVLDHFLSRLQPLRNRDEIASRLAQPDELLTQHQLILLCFFVVFLFDHVNRISVRRVGDRSRRDVEN